MKTRYYVCGLGYNEHDSVTDYEQNFGNFDTYEGAFELFTKLQSKDDESFFTNAPEVYALLVQVEECEETADSINCVDVKNEYWITNPEYCD